MATLGKIRQHGVLLLCIVGIAMLAFIVGDFLSSSTSFFRGRQTIVGEIEGVNVDYFEFEEKVNNLTEVYKIETGRSDYDEDMNESLRSQTWQMLVSDITLGKQAKEIGMRITDNELSQLCIGENPHQLIRSRRAFYDESGNFNRFNLINFINSLEQDVDNEDQAANLKQAKNYWLYWENAVRLTRLQEKYTNLLSKCIGANSLDAKYAFDAANNSLNVEYVMKPYFAMADDAVKVSESDVKKLYNQRKQTYKQQPNRTIGYITFDLKPSADDDADVKARMEKLQDEFISTDDVVAFVNTNSDILYNGRNYTINDIPEQYKEFAFAKGAKEGDHTELALIDGYYTIARIIKAGYALPDSVEVKFVATEEGQEDQVLGWYNEEQLGKDMAAKAFACKKGERFTMPYGMQEQTFEVTNVAAASPRVQLAILAREVIVTDRTKALTYNEAMQFIIDNPTAEQFLAAAGEKNYEVHTCAGLQAITNKVDGMKQSREIVRWAFEAKEGDVAQEAYQCGDQYVIAALTQVNNDEYRPFEQVKAELQYFAINKAKAAQIAGDLAGVATIEEAAEKLGAEINHVENLTLESYRFGNMGAEPAVIGKAFNLKAGEISEPIEGVAGVYVIKVSDKTAAEVAFNKDAQIQQLNMRTSYSLPYQALRVIEEKAEITDNRAKFQ